MIFKFFSDYLNLYDSKIKNIGKIIKIIFFNKSFHLNIYIKIMNHAINKNNKILLKYIENRIYIKCSCYINPKATFGINTVFPHPIGIVIGEGVSIGSNVIIYQNVTIGRKDINTYGYPIIQDNCIIYANSVIAGNVTIAKNTIIGANSVVVNDTEPNSVYVGVPAKRIK